MPDDSLVRDEIQRITGDRNTQMPEKKVLERVSGFVTDQRPKGMLGKGILYFLGKDPMTLANDIRRDAKPRVKTFIQGLFHQFIDSAFNSGPGNNGYYNGGYTSYGSMYRSYNYSSIQQQPTYNSMNAAPPPFRYHWSAVYMSSWDKAENLLRVLRATIDRYKNVSVQDLYEILSEDPDMPTPIYEMQDSYMGWTDLYQVPMESTSRGIWVKLPRPIQLN